MSNTHLVNPALLAMAYQKVAAEAPNSILKSAFVPAGDPTMDPAAAGAGGGGGAPPGADPMAGGAGGGAPPGPPPAPPPPPPPAAPMGGMPGQQMVEPIKPKIDVNVELMTIKKLLAKLCDAMGVQIPAADMAVDSTDLTNMATGQGAQPMGGGQPPQSAIPPIAPVQPAMPTGGAGGKMGSDRFNNGHAFDTGGLTDLGSMAQARLFQWRAQNGR